MDIKIVPNNLTGKITTPPSKSILHRALIMSALLKKSHTVLTGVDTISDDIMSTIRCLTAIGTKITIEKDSIHIYPINKIPKDKLQVNCGESGTTLRLMLPILYKYADEIKVGCQNNLKNRPVLELINALEESGLSFKTKTFPLIFSGDIKTDSFKIKGDVTSQYISGLMLLASSLEENITINLTTPIESRQYVDLTIKMLNEFGVTIKEKRNKFVVLKRKNLSSNFEEYPIEGDWSNAAFFIAAGCLGQRIRVIQLKNDSLQGDKEVLQLLMKAGANISVNDKDYLAESSKLKAFNYDFTDNPDLFPVMSIVAAFAKGTSKLTGGRRLRFKESDRINSTFQMLKNLGANVDRTENGLTIEGKEMLEGGKVHSFCDHRIVMAAAIASIRCKKPVSIIKAESVSKSYPNFFEEFERIGGKVSVIG